MLTICDIMGCKSHFVVLLINICDLCVSIDISVGKYVLLSDVLLMCHSIHLVRLLIDTSIGGPYIDLCLLIGVSESLLIYRSGNTYCCLISY